MLININALSPNIPSLYDRIEVVRIAASNTIDKTSVNNSLLPKDLNTSDYSEVANYYGFGNGHNEGPVLQK